MSAGSQAAFPRGVGDTPPGAGAHPRPIVVYPAAGSHGTYDGNELYIGWGESGTGFGCDSTTTPTHLVSLNVVLVPNAPEPESEYAWLLNEGRWGELKSWELRGPYGPNTGSQWSQPVPSMEN